MTTTAAPKTYTHANLGGTFTLRVRGAGWTHVFTFDTRDEADRYAARYAA